MANNEHSKKMHRRAVQNDGPLGELRKTMTLREIADIYGVSRERIRQRLKRSGLDIDEDLKYRYRCRDCDELIGRGAMPEHRETYHPKERLGHTLSPESELKHEAILKMYLDGERLSDISRTIRTSSGTPLSFPSVYYVLRRYGIEPNRGGGRYIRDDLWRERRKEHKKQLRGWRADEIG